MNEERKTAEVEAVGDEDGRRQLWVRAGMAVGLIGLLLGGLAVFGLNGFVIGPLVAALFMASWDLFAPSAETDAPTQ